MGDQEIYTEKQMNKIKNKIFKYVNEQDKEGLKNLFSKDSQRKIEDLDSKLDQFISTFNGNKIESAKVLSPAFEGSVDAQPLHIYGVIRRKKLGSPFIKVCRCATSAHLRRLRLKT